MQAMDDKTDFRILSSSTCHLRVMKILLFDAHRIKKKDSQKGDKLTNVTFWF